MATTYIVRKSIRPDLKDRPEYARFVKQSSRKPSRGRKSGTRNDRGQGARPDARPAGGRRRGGRQEMAVDLSRLVNKAAPGATETPFIPKHTFSDFPIDARLKENILARGYGLPTPIQDGAIPHVLRGADVVGLANTGTGKTAAFLIPLIDKVLKLRELGETERVLIMVPTRELAIQIEAEFWGFAKRLGLNAVVCVGGAGIEAQIRVLRRAPSFVIGTPGRLKDLEERRELAFSDFRSVVLDEADRMLDMGFIEDMRFILGKTPAERQTLFFSATMEKAVERLIGEFLKDPVTISVKTRDTAATVDQDVVRVTRDTKFKTLVELLKRPECEKTLVFGRTKHGVERLTRDLRRAGVKAESIHGDKTHGKRQKALGLFKANQANVLVATDVAARGLDISGVSHVINYDLPATYEDYTHRIGRTGRAGKTGTALTFIEENA